MTMFKAERRVVLPMSTAQVSPGPPRPGFLDELAAYFGRFRLFTRRDWLVYVAWVGLIASLGLASAAFLAVGRRAGAVFPASAYFLPIGAGIFALAIAVDTIGHRTVYKEYLRGGEGLVHHIIIGCGIGSCVLLCAAYPTPSSLQIPALVLTALSFIYSFVDEVMHWRRYLSSKSDVVEMWSHVFILIGHGMMMLGWWLWYGGGYQGVAVTLTALSGW
jgi:hypothetical protein